MSEERRLIDRVVEATETAMTRMQQEMTQMTQRASQAASSNLPVATRDDVARLQASLDRIEAAVNDLTAEMRGRTGAPGGDVTGAGTAEPPPTEPPVG
jgi:hypothetical protein